MRAAPSLALVGALLLAGCGDSSEPAPETAEAAAPAAGPAPQVADFAALASKDCAEVAQFYFEALSGKEYAKAALVWSHPAVTADRLQAAWESYKDPRIEWNDPVVEGAAGSLYCNVTGKLTDAADPSTPELEGVVLLRRANDVPGATEEELRWTVRSSTFIEPMSRSDDRMGT